jgi:hypothetical protein
VSHLLLPPQLVDTPLQVMHMTCWSHHPWLVLQQTKQVPGSCQSCLHMQPQAALLLTKAMAHLHLKQLLSSCSVLLQ